MNQTDICNIALSLVGSQRITIITENSEAARVLAAIYPNVLDTVMSAHPWTFSTKRVVLAMLATPPAFGYDNQHQIPSDCLRPLKAYNGTSDDDYMTEYKVEDNKILSNEGTVYLRYIKRNTDCSTYNSAFINTLAARLAADIAFPIANDKSLAEALMKSYALKLSEAKALDSQSSGKIETEGEDTWEGSRV